MTVVHLPGQKLKIFFGPNSEFLVKGPIVPARAENPSLLQLTVAKTVRAYGPEMAWWPGKWRGWLPELHWQQRQPWVEGVPSGSGCRPHKASEAAARLTGGSPLRCSSLRTASSVFLKAISPKPHAPALPGPACSNTFTTDLKAANPWDVETPLN